LVKRGKGGRSSFLGLGGVSIKIFNGKWRLCRGEGKKKGEKKLGGTALAAKRKKGGGGLSGPEGNHKRRPRTGGKRRKVSRPWLKDKEAFLNLTGGGSFVAFYAKKKEKKGERNTWKGRKSLGFKEKRKGEHLAIAPIEGEKRER